jgi:hypothetical protein
MFRGSIAELAACAADVTFLKLGRTVQIARDQRLCRSRHEKPVHHPGKAVAPREKPRPFQRCAVRKHLAAEVPGKDLGGGAFRGLDRDVFINYAFSRAYKGKKIVRPIVASGRLCNFGTLC